MDDEIKEENVMKFDHRWNWKMWRWNRDEFDSKWEIRSSVLQKLCDCAGLIEVYMEWHDKKKFGNAFYKSVVAAGLLLHCGNETSVTSISVMQILAVIFQLPCSAHLNSRFFFSLSKKRKIKRASRKSYCFDAIRGKYIQNRPFRGNQNYIFFVIEISWNIWILTIMKLLLCSIIECA